MVKLRPSVVAPTTKIFRLDLSQAQSDNLLVASRYITIGTTSNIVYVPLFTAKYTIDTQGIITVDNIFIQIVANNSANARCKIQVSGDGGVTPFKDMTGDIGAGVDLITAGEGLWITSINIGVDQFQIRVLGRSTNGNPANIILRNGESVAPETFGELTIRKTFF